MKFFAYFLFVLSISNCTTMNEPLVIGHRGAMGHETENTIASIEKALEMKVDMIEIDVFNVESGETVVFHDQNLERLTNAGGNIEEWSYYDLTGVIVEGGHKIPLLQDVLKIIDHKTKLNIELKGSNTANRINFITDYYIKERGWKLEDFLISSFKWDELKAIRKLNPDIPIAVLTEDDPVDAIGIAKELNAEAINPNYKNLNAENSAKIKEAGFKINVWTVNEPNDISAMKALEVDGIITNFPERVR